MTITEGTYCPRFHIKINDAVANLLTSATPSTVGNFSGFIHGEFYQLFIEFIDSSGNIINGKTFSGPENNQFDTAPGAISEFGMPMGGASPVTYDHREGEPGFFFCETKYPHLDTKFPCDDLKPYQLYAKEEVNTPYREGTVRVFWDRPVSRGYGSLIPPNAYQIEAYVLEVSHLPHEDSSRWFEHMELFYNNYFFNQTAYEASSYFFGGSIDDYHRHDDAFFSFENAFEAYDVSEYMLDLTYRVVCRAGQEDDFCNFDEKVARLPVLYGVRNVVRVAAQTIVGVGDWVNISYMPSQECPTGSIFTHKFAERPENGVCGAADIVSKLQFTLQLGMSRADFDDAKQTDYKNAIASSLNIAGAAGGSGVGIGSPVAGDNIAIKSITENTATATFRRLLSTTIDIETEVVSSNQKDIQVMNENFDMSVINMNLGSQSLPTATLEGNVTTDRSYSSADACQACVEGTYCFLDERYYCPPNSQSSKLAENISDCTCNAGFFKSFDGSTDGPYDTALGHTVHFTCLSCSENHYCPGNNSRYACPSSSSVAAGSGTALESCKCNAGFTGPDGGACTACASGTFKTTIGSQPCLNCPVDTYSGATGAISATTCQGCPSSTSTDGSVGQTSRAACVCDAGHTPASSEWAVVAYGEVIATGLESATLRPHMSNLSSCLAACVLADGCSQAYFKPGDAADASNLPVCKTYTGHNDIANFNPANGDGGLTYERHACEACGFGKYKVAVGSAPCTSCADGSSNSFYTDSRASDSPDDCVQCMSNGFIDNPDQIGVASDCVCDMGFYITITQRCLACAAGTYKASQDREGISSCLQCAANNYSAAGSSSCTDCPAHSASPAGSGAITDCVCLAGYERNGDVCNACQAGHHKALAGNTDGCVACATGTYQGSTAASACETCRSESTTAAVGSTQASDCVCIAGFYDSSGVCTACADGHVKPLDGNGICTPCSQNTYASGENCVSCGNLGVSDAASEGVEACECAAGEGFVGGSCQQCAAGSFKAAVGDVLCQQCVNNSFSDSGGATTCTNCHANSLAADGSTARIDCECVEGYETGVDTEGDVVCNECGVGHYKSSVSNTELCTACDAGDFQNATGASACVQCRANTFSLGAASTCTLCTDHSTSPAGSDAETDCLCDPGYKRCACGSYCEPCPIGTFKIASSNDQTCTSCEPGFTTRANTSIAASACRRCEAGEYETGGVCRLCGPNSQSAAGSVACQCRAGFFYTGSEDNTDGERCVACPERSYKTSPGTGACTLCSLGYEDSGLVPRTSSSVCSICPANTYGSGDPYRCTNCTAYSNSQAGSDAVTDCTCNAGYTGSPGASGQQGTCIACAPGTYLDNFVCTACERGKYSGVFGATSSATCQPCPNHTTQAAHDTDRSTVDGCLCEPGYGFNDGTGVCERCTAGSYKPSLADVACTNCPVDTYHDPANASDLHTLNKCRPCAPDSESLAGSFGIDSCVCRSGFIQQPIEWDLVCNGLLWRVEGYHYAMQVQFNPVSDRSLDYCLGLCVGMCKQVAFEQTDHGTRCHFYTIDVQPNGNSSTFDVSDSTIISQGTCVNVTIDGTLLRYTTYSRSPTCVPCPAGFFCPTQTEQLPCVNRSSSLAGSSSQLQCSCNPGTYGDASGKWFTGLCTMCNANSYCEGGNYMFMFSCPQNSYSPRGSASIEACVCAPGYYALANHTCVLCPPNTFCANDQQNSCPPNSQAPASSTDATHCVCDPTFRLAADGRTCEPCGPNVLCLGDDIEPFNCPNNSRVLHQQCMCADGFFCGNGSSNASCYEECHPCPVGSWCRDNQRHTCQDHSTSVAGSSRVQACNCLDGHYKVGNTCPVCEPDFFCANNQRTACRTVDPLSTSAAGAATEADCQCSPGHFQLTPSDTCKNCPPDFFCPEPLISLQCPENMFHRSVAQTHLSDCICLAGFRQTADGIITQCLPCLDGERCEAGSVEPENCGISGRIANADHTKCVCRPGQTEKDYGDLIRCEACAPGYVKDFAGNEDCEPCAAGTYSASTTLCVDCPRNAKSEAASSSCACVSPYVAGQNASAPDECSLCPAGQYRLNNVTCVPCHPHSHAEEGSDGLEDCDCVAGAAPDASGMCAPCPANHYQHGEQCLPCGTDADAPPSSSSPNACTCNATLCRVAAFGSPALAGCHGACAAPPPDCVECAVGKAKNQIGNRPCSFCLHGEYQDHTGQALCEQCPSYEDHLLTGQISLSACKCVAGRYRVTNSSIPADHGSCVECAIGSAKRDLGDHTCSPCLIGEFQDTTGQTACQLCDGHARALTDATTTFFTGSTNVSDCTCPSGHFSNSSACLPCATGRYKAAKGTQACSFCGKSTDVSLQHKHGTVGETGAISEAHCINCPGFSGQLSATIGESYVMSAVDDCLCHPGHETVSSSPNEDCVQCAQYTFRTTYSDADCTFCAPGYYWLGTSVQCSQCDIDSSDNSGKSVGIVINPLSNNTWGRDQADCGCKQGYHLVSDTCYPCAAGTYRSDISVRGCVLCPVDHYQDSEGQSSCQRCPDNSNTANQTGSRDVIQCICDGGYELDSSSSQHECAQCAAGKYSTSGSACQDCPAGTFSAAGATECTSCGANERSQVASPSENHCNCEPGFGGGPPDSSTHAACLPCPAGSFSVGGAVDVTDSARRPTCEPCPGGKNSTVESISQADCKCRPGFGVDPAAQPNAACLQCESGKFSPGGANRLCFECGFGAVSEVGSDSVDDCECDASIGLYEV